MNVNAEYQKLANKLRQFAQQNSTKLDDNAQESLNALAKAVELLGSRPVLQPETEKFIDLTHEITKLYVDKNNIRRASLEQALNTFGVAASLVRIDEAISRLMHRSTNERGVIRPYLIDIAEAALIALAWLDTKELKA